MPLVFMLSRMIGAELTVVGDSMMAVGGQPTAVGGKPAGAQNVRKRGKIQMPEVKKKGEKQGLLFGSGPHSQRTKQKNIEFGHSRSKVAR